MRNFISLMATAALVFISPLIAAQDAVITDGDVSLSYDELAFFVGRWTPQMQEVAVTDEGDRLELLNMVLANKKLALEAEKLTAEKPELHWTYMAGMRAYQRDFVLRHYAENIEFPDFSELAHEQYVSKKDKYALVPERRMSSHILFSAPPGFPRDDILVEAQGVLDELRAGADFVEMVKLHSDEPNAAAKEGKFNLWMQFGEQSVSPPYSEGVFEIGNVGEYSELVQTQFGVHIIRLDGIQEKSYKPYDEVKGKILAELETEYRGLAMKDFVSKFQISEDAVIDGEAVEKILAPYNTGE